MVTQVLKLFGYALLIMILIWLIQQVAQRYNVPIIKDISL
ncbi:MAG: hypothetical protein DDT22_00862 [candidate division WS2 bacterium]|nr:hypothetical protein [Candidatus Lithacetigena glycinireducens]